MFVFTMNNEQSDRGAGNHLSSLSSVRSGYSALTATEAIFYLLISSKTFIYCLLLELFPISSFSYNIYKFNSVSPPPPRTSPSSVNPVNTARNISGVQVGQNTILSHQISNQKSTL